MYVVHEHVWSWHLKKVTFWVAHGSNFQERYPDSPNVSRRPCGSRWLSTSGLCTRQWPELGELIQGRGVSHCPPSWRHQCDFVTGQPWHHVPTPLTSLGGLPWMAGTRCVQSPLAPRIPTSSHPRWTEHPPMSASWKTKSECLLWVWRCETPPFVSDRSDYCWFP